MSSPITAPPTAPKTTLAKTIAASETADPFHLKFALAEMDLALSGYEEAEAYYDGTKAESFSHPRIARALRNTKDKYKINFAKTPVNVVADRLAISSVTVRRLTEAEAEADAPTTGDPANPNQDKKPDDKNDFTKLFEKKVWRKCAMETLIEDLHLKTSEYGDGYLFVWTDTEADPDNPEATVSNNQPVIYYNSPKTTRIIYDPEAPDKPLFAIKKWKHFNGRMRVNLYYADRTEHFQLAEKVKPDSKEAGDPLSWDSLGEATENPYDRIPVFHFRNRLPYGRPEHVDGYGPQDAVNKISTTMVHSTEWEGFPQRYALADANQSLDGGGTGSDWDDETEATQPEDTDQDEMQSGPGTILKLDNIKQVGTFEVGDPATMLQPMEFYVRSLAQTTTTPLRYFYPPGAHPPSGESYRAEDTPLIQKVTKRQKWFTPTHADWIAFAMEIVTDIPADEFTIDIKWAPPASIDDALGWDTVKKKIEAGVPRRQALIEAGYTADQVDRWLAENNDKAELQRDVEVFSLFAAAAKNMADAATAGGLNPEAVGKVLTETLQKFYGGKDKLPQPEKKDPILDTPPQLRPFVDPSGTPQPGGNGQPKPGTRITPPPRLDMPPGGVKPDRQPATYQ